MALYGGALPGTAAVRPTYQAGSSGALPKWEPSTLGDIDLVTEERGHGPLTERVVSALIPMHDATEWKGVKAAEEAMEGRPGTNGAAAAAARDKLNVADLEDRMRNVMRFHGLLDDIVSTLVHGAIPVAHNAPQPDYSEAVDDPIASALRHAQRELRTVLATNEARRLRLAAIAEDRLAHQEYVDGRDALDKNITTLYSKLQKKDGPKVNKKKKQKGDPMYGAANGISLTGTAALPPCPAALGLSPDDHHQLHIPDQLQELVRTRRNWVDAIGGVFEEKERDQPGRIWGFPQESVYAGIEDEVREDRRGSRRTRRGCEAHGVVARTTKGKARAGEGSGGGVLAGRADGGCGSADAACGRGCGRGRGCGCGRVYLASNISRWISQME